MYKSESSFLTAHQHIIGYSVLVMYKISFHQIFRVTRYMVGMINVILIMRSPKWCRYGN